MTNSLIWTYLVSGQRGEEPQQLERRVNQLECENERQQREIEQLQRRLQRLNQRLRDVERNCCGELDPADDESSDD